jgi:hypothetical protein
MGAGRSSGESVTGSIPSWDPNTGQISNEQGETVAYADTFGRGNQNNRPDFRRKNSLRNRSEPGQQEARQIEELNSQRAQAEAEAASRGGQISPDPGYTRQFITPLGVSDISGFPRHGS